MSVKCMTRAAHALQEKKRLEEALLELQRVNESLLDAARPEEITAPAAYSMSAESSQLLGQLRSRQRVNCPVSGLEHSSGGLSADAQKDEVQIPSWSMPVSIYWEGCEAVKACTTLSVALAYVWRTRQRTLTRTKCLSLVHICHLDNTNANILHP